jgi:hypothetical protein
MSDIERLRAWAPGEQCMLGRRAPQANRGNRSICALAKYDGSR